MKDIERYNLIKRFLDSGKYVFNIENQEVYSPYKGGYLKKALTHDGYEYVTFIIDRKKSVKIKIHQLVAVFLGWDIVGKPINHIDGNKRNNHPSNLEVVTQSENEKHAYKLGLKDRKGMKSFVNKLTDKDVLEIKRMYKERKNYMSQRELAELFGVTQSVISNIVNNRKWKHIKGE